MSAICRNHLGLSFVPVMMLVAGCNMPARLVWSPDGSKAAYRVDLQGYVLDRKGEVLSSLDVATFGIDGFVWSSDSTTLYFVGTECSDAAAAKSVPREVEWGWLDLSHRPVPPTDRKERTTDDRRTSAEVISRWRDGKVTPLCEAPGMTVRLRLSPDGNWLAGTAVWNQTPGNKGDSDELLVYAHSLRSGRTYAVARQSGVAVCFTGVDRLAYVQTTPRADGKMEPGGRVIEMRLADDPAAPRRESLPDAMPTNVAWLEPCGGEGDLLISYTNLPPPAALLDDDSDARWTIAHFDRRRGILKTLVEDTDGQFVVNPAGEKILFHQFTGAKDSDPPPRTLCVVNADGTGRRTLRNMKWTADGQDHYEPGLCASWHGNDQFYLATPSGPAVGTDGLNDRIVYFDVHLYKLAGAADGDGIRRIGSFGDDWPRRMKPRVQFSSQPRAKPSTGCPASPGSE